MFAAYLIFGKKKETVIEEVRPVVMTETPAVDDITLYTDLIGTIEPAEVVTVYPKMSGEVLEVNFSVGETVTAGQVLCKICLLYTSKSQVYSNSIRNSRNQVR